MGFVENAVPLPAGKVDRAPSTVPADQKITASEYNALINAVNDLASYVRGVAAVAVAANGKADDALAAVDFGAGEFEWIVGNEEIPGTNLTWYTVRIQTPTNHSPDVCFPAAPQSGQYILLQNSGPGTLSIRADGYDGAATKFIPPNGTSAVVLEAGDSVLVLGEPAGYRLVAQSPAAPMVP